MKLRLIALSLALVWVCLAGDKEPPTARGENDELAIEAVLHRDHADVQELLGVQIEEDIVVAVVTVTPKGKPVKIWLDDFFLRSEKDGQRSEPYSPGEIAGGSVMTVNYDYSGGAVMQNQTGPIWGGMGGTRPRRLPGASDGAGNTAGVEQASGIDIAGDPEEAKKTPLLERLEDLVLEEGEISEPVSGFLYFPLEGKHKDKHLWLHYNGVGDRIDLHFDKD